MEKVSRLYGYMQSKVFIWSPVISLSWVDEMGDLARQMYLEFAKNSTREETAAEAERTLEWCRAPTSQVFSWVLIGSWKWRNQRMEKESPERTRRSKPRSSLCSVASVMSTSLQPYALPPTRLLLHGILQARIWNGLPCPPPGDLPDLGIEPVSLASPALADRFFTLVLP